MKLYSKILFTVLVPILSSCEGYFDKSMETTMNEDIVFSSYENAASVAYSVYADLPQGLSEIWGSSSSAMMASATDEAEFAIQNHSVQKFNLGSWSPTDLPNNPFSNYYASIRKVYNFLENADRVNYDDVKNNPSQPGVYEQRIENIRQLKHEVLLLRAFYMFELIKRFGGVPIVKEKFTTDVDYSTIKRNTLEECVNEIVYWCDSTAKVLPAKQPDAELGRLTSGAAKALKSEVLLFAASDLWNDNAWAADYEYPELISLPVGDRNQRWKDAANAAKAVIDMESEAGYGLDNLDNLFNSTSFTSKEIIFCKRDAASNSFETTNIPIGFDKATGGNCPSQNLVDAFDVIDNSGSEPVAQSFDWTNPVHVASPYTNRDPRLEKFIITNNSYFKSRNVECWTGGLDGQGVRNATPTGYYIRKYVYPWSDLNIGQTSVHTWIYIRLAEIYLNYIEALNECDPTNPDIKIYYNKIRSRAGMPDMPEGLGQDEVRELIRKERFVELCFEGKRFFDLRRWMDDDALAAPLRAVEITKNGENFTYKPYDLESRVFSPKMYFYPIPQTEINKMPHWPQNPLW